MNCELLEEVRKYRSIALIDAGHFRISIVKNLLNLSDDARFDWQAFKDMLGCSDYHYFDHAYPDSGRERFYTFLEKQLRFRIHTFGMKKQDVVCPSCRQRSEMSVQSGVDVGITVMAMRLAFADAYDQIILCTGDSDFVPLVNTLRDGFGKRVVVCGLERQMSSMLIDASNAKLLLDEYRDMLIKNKGDGE